jgi:hypothetical protein
MSLLRYRVQELERRGHDIVDGQLGFH